jgi:hypothetical protein
VIKILQIFSENIFSLLLFSMSKHQYDESQ